MRSILFLLTFFAALPVAVLYPFIGGLMWVWFSLMNPHRLVWANFEIPFAVLIALATSVGLLNKAGDLRMPKGIEFKLMIILYLFFFISTVYSLAPYYAWQAFANISKIFYMNIVLCFLITDFRKYKVFILVLTLSVALLGAWGGLTSIASGGKSIVWGPEESFIGDNNTFGMAETMILPLLVGLFRTSDKRAAKILFATFFILTTISVLFSYSRGVFLGLVIFFLCYALLSRHKVICTVAIALGAMVILYNAPDSWMDRMRSIYTYQEDDSAMARVYGPKAAVEIATMRPLVGGGFRVDHSSIYRWVNPHSSNVAIHNSFFQMLAEQGIPAFVVFLLLFLISLSHLYGIRRRYGTHHPYGVMAESLGLSFVPYIVAGSTMPRAYFDLLFFLFVGVIALRMIDRNNNQDIPSPKGTTWDG